ncbi:MAG: sugar phosphate isomerase/epimerase family protein [Pseudonocardiaceae bacterium]
MELGFFTDCMPGRDLTSLAAWAARVGFAALEVAAWPASQSRDHPSHLNVQNFGTDQAASVLQLFAKHGLTLSAVSYYDNNLHPDQEQRTRNHEHLRACIVAAALLEVPCVGTFIGRDPSRTVTENLVLAQRELPPLVEFAGERAVKLVVENCPMPGWHPDGYPGNLAYSPEQWEWMFSLGLYLNYDPSHLVWLGIDPVRVLREHVDRVLHVQAKDTQVDADSRNRYGVYGQVMNRTNPWELGWWRYRVPGLGDVDWRGVIDTLYEGGYDGVVAIEHEDPVWSGTEERVDQGLEVARRTLAPLLVG